MREVTPFLKSAHIYVYSFFLLLSADSDHLPVTVSEFTERMAILRASMDEGLDDEYSVSYSDT